jgi:NitT/TauT family transport system substrate-binding protein
LNKLAQRDDLDAVLNFWHYSARLKASGFKALVSLPDILKELGITRPIPVIGWVFSEQWAANNTEAVKGFLAAAKEAQQIMLSSDEEWQRIRPKMKVETDAMFDSLRDAFRAGVPHCFNAEDVQSAKNTFAILAKLGGSQLVGKSTALSEGTFWKQHQVDVCDDRK